MENALSTLIGEELEGNYTCRGVVQGANGSIYGIPYYDRQVIKFNPVDESIIYIGPDFGDQSWKWSKGAMDDKGIIYCPPMRSNRGILKIDTNTDTVTELDANLMPERGDYSMWFSCALALDGCIYFMPSNARRILKLDPYNNDAISIVGDDLGDGHRKYIGTVMGIDRCLYGIPNSTNRIVKYDPINDITSFIGEEATSYGFLCNGHGALGRDGCIYAARLDGRVLKINTNNDSHCIVGHSIDRGHFDNSDAILGIDGCIYWPPLCNNYIRKYDPHTNQTSLVGKDFGSKNFKWYGGCLASDGVVYCMPANATRILSIDPWKDYTSSMKNSMEEHPEQLGCLFQPSNDIPEVTNFDRVVTKFGRKKVLEALEDCMTPVDQSCADSNLYPFMIAASYENSDISVIYQLLRQTPSFVNCTHRASHDSMRVNKRKCKALDDGDC